MPAPPGAVRRLAGRLPPAVDGGTGRLILHFVADRHLLADFLCVRQGNASAESTAGVRGYEGMQFLLALAVC